jgi:hypothetical protein
LKTIDISDRAGPIVAGVVHSLVAWVAILQQEDKNKNWHQSRYESGLWNRSRMRYDAGKCRCRGLMQARNKFCNSIHAVRFHIETDTNTLVHQLNLHANDLPGALVSCRIAWIWQFDFEVNDDRMRLNGGPDGLSWQPLRAASPHPKEVGDIEETI